MFTRTRTTRKVVVLTAVAALGTVLLSGCSSDDGGSGTGSKTSSDSKGKTTVTVGLFGTFGFKEAGLYAEYEKQHPNIKIQQTVITRNENYYPALVNHLTTGSGLSDIQGIEVGNIAEVTGTPTLAAKFEDLSKVSGVNKSDYLGWKWTQGTTKDGSTVGIGTDVGPMAICYRKDLFAKAGLSTDREVLAKQWAGDWSKLVEVGKQYKAHAPAGTTFLDSAGGLLNAITSSEKNKFYDNSGQVIYKTNPAIKAAFDLTAAAATDGLTGKLQQFQPSWNQAIANSKFAAISCPPWMIGTLKGAAKPADAGKWDVAQAPKGGNWGGSFLGIPKSGKNKTEAEKLAAWLTAPAQQAKLFVAQGSFPSAQAAYSLPTVIGAKNAFVGTAPIGTIFAAAAKAAPVQVIGPKDAIIQQGLSDNGVFLVAAKGKSAADAWKTATETIDNNLEK